MILKHEIYFLFWQLYALLKGIYIGKKVWTHSEDMGWVQGIISGRNGDSITKNFFGFYFTIDWEDSLVSHRMDPTRKYYRAGSYKISNFGYGKEVELRNPLIK